MGLNGLTPLQKLQSFSFKPIGLGYFAYCTDSELSRKTEFISYISITKMVKSYLPKALFFMSNLRNIVAGLDEPKNLNKIKQ